MSKRCTACHVPAASFAASSTLRTTLAASVGHNERIAERVVAGEAWLSVGSVVVYFKALGVELGPAAVEAWEAEQVVLRRIAAAR